MYPSRQGSRLLPDHVEYHGPGVNSFIPFSASPPSSPPRGSCKGESKDAAIERKPTIPPSFLSFSLSPSLPPFLPSFLPFLPPSLLPSSLPSFSFSHPPSLNYQYCLASYVYFLITPGLWMRSPSTERGTGLPGGT